MKICIFGAGAIGGYMGAKLAEAGAEVSLVARGPHLAAMREKGLTLVEEGETKTFAVNASDDPAALGVQDYVIVTLQGAFRCRPWWARCSRLIGPETTIRVGGERGAVVVFPQDRRPAGRDAAGLGRSGRRANGTGSGRTACWAVSSTPAAEVTSPGVVKHIEGNRFSLGEPDGSKSGAARCG